jgi:hypothetical protein
MPCAGMPRAHWRLESSSILYWLIRTCARTRRSWFSTDVDARAGEQQRMRVAGAGGITAVVAAMQAHGENKQLQVRAIRVLVNSLCDYDSSRSVSQSPHLVTEKDTSMANVTHAGTKSPPEFLQPPK